MLFLLHRSISESLCRNCVSFICWYIKMDFFFCVGGNVPAPPTTPPPPTLLLKKSFLRSFEIDKRLFFSIRFVPLVILVHQRSVQSGRQLYFETSIENVCNGRMNVLINFVSPPPFYI